MDVVCAGYSPITEGYRSSFEILKVGDVIDDPNSCHMGSIRQSHDFGDLWAFVGFTIKVLEEPKNRWFQGFRSDGLDEAFNTIY
jgi:hypothetical protein